MPEEEVSSKVIDISFSSISVFIKHTFSEFNSEESILSPFRSPRVLGNPVFSSVFNSPSDNLDGMSSESISVGLLIDSILVVHEVLVDHESSLDGSVLEDFGLDLSRASKGLG